LWAAVSTPPYERLPPFSTPDDPRAGGQRKKGPVPISLTRVWAPAFSRRSNFGAQSRAARSCTQERPPARKAVREQRTRNRPTRPYFDTLVTFLWYDLAISGGLRSVGWGTSLPRVTTLSFPPYFLVCNTLLLNGGLISRGRGQLDGGHEERGRTIRPSLTTTGRPAPGRPAPGDASRNLAVCRSAA
jgi:hypothetical protein